MDPKAHQPDVDPTATGHAKNGAAKHPAPVTDFVDGVIERRAAQISKSPETISLTEFVRLMIDRPRHYFRTAVQYTRDASLFFGRDSAKILGEPGYRYNFLRAPTLFRDTVNVHGVHGQDRAVSRYFAQLEEIGDQGALSHLFLFRGPHGSGKTTLTNAFDRLLTEYSKTDEGAVFRLALRFGSKKDVGKVLGLSDKRRSPKTIFQSDNSGFIIPSSINCHPILFFPHEAREALYKTHEWEKAGVHRKSFLGNTLDVGMQSYIDVLLEHLEGDYQKLIANYLVAQRFIIGPGQGLSEYHPPVSTGARAERKDSPMLGETEWLPTELQHGRERLRSLRGLLVTANRGHLGVNDLGRGPQRNLAAYEPLRDLVEQGTTTAIMSGGNVDTLAVRVDVLVRASANDKSIDSLKEEAGAGAFFGITHQIPVPNPIEYLEEVAIHRERLVALLGSKRVLAPHTLEILSLFAVATRLMIPNGDYYGDASEAVQDTLSWIGPIEKAIILQQNKDTTFTDLNLMAHHSAGGRYSRNMKETFTGIHVQEWEKAVALLSSEFDPYQIGFDTLPQCGDFRMYDGGFGVSTREVGGWLGELTAQCRNRDITVVEVINFLRQKVEAELPYYKVIKEALDDSGEENIDDMLSDPEKLLEEITNFAKAKIRRDLWDAVGGDLEDDVERTCRYIIHVGNYVTNGNVKIPVPFRAVKRDDKPDERLMRGIEETLATPVKERNKDEHRRLIWSQAVGAISGARTPTSGEKDDVMKHSCDIWEVRFADITAAISNARSKDDWKILHGFRNDCQYYDSNPSAIDEDQKKDSARLDNVTRYLEALAVLKGSGYTAKMLARLAEFAIPEHGEGRI